MENAAHVLQLLSHLIAKDITFHCNHYATIYLNPATANECWTQQQARLYQLPSATAPENEIVTNESIGLDARQRTALRLTAVFITITILDSIHRPVFYLNRTMDNVRTS
jgi:hypothetical protein